MFKQIVIGLILLISGLTMIYYSIQLVDMVGRNQWMERKLGGTRNAIVLFGFGLIVFGVLFMFGVLQASSSTNMSMLSIG